MSLINFAIIQDEGFLHTGSFNHLIHFIFILFFPMEKQKTP